MQDTLTPKVVPFTARPADPDVIETLEDALARAKRGDFVSVAVCAATASGESCRLYADNGQQHTLLASLVLMQARLTAHLLSESKDLDPVS